MTDAWWTDVLDAKIRKGNVPVVFSLALPSANNTEGGREVERNIARHFMSSATPIYDISNYVLTPSVQRASPSNHGVRSNAHPLPQPTASVALLSIADAAVVTGVLNEQPINISR